MATHKHAALMALYAQDAMETDEPWTRWQVRRGDTALWEAMGSYPSWSPTIQYRRKPRTIRIGEFDVPEPLRAAPERGVQYWQAYPGSEFFSDACRWNDDDVDRLFLQRGLIHLTREAAELHGRALVSLTEQKS